MKGLHKDSIRKVDNPHQWMIHDARIELLQQIKAEVERLKKSYDVYLARVTKEDFLNDLENILSFIDTLKSLSFLDTLEKEYKKKKINKCRLNMISEQQLARDHETFTEHNGRLPDPPQEPIPVIVGAASYETLSDILAIGFMDYLDRNRTEGKMCLSGWECDDIMKAFRKQDWKRIERYRDKYLLSKKD